MNDWEYLYIVGHNLIPSVPLPAPSGFFFSALIKWEMFFKQKRGEE